MFFKSEPLKIFNFSTFLQTQILMLPVLYLFYQENGLDAGDLFLIQGIFSITALLFEIPAGYIGDIFPRRNVLIFSYSLFLMRLILWYFFRGYWIIVVGEILYSMSKAFYSGVADGYIYDYLKSQGKTKKMLTGYGRLNFWMSTGTALASLVGPFLYERYGFPVLIIIEMILNTAAIALLFLLPKVASFHKKNKGIVAKYRDLYQITKNTLSNEQLRPYIFYSGIIAATTTVFVWGFQPLMKMSFMPIEWFGIIYFVNHACRALASFCLPHTFKIFSLKEIGKLTYVLYILSFLGIFAITQFPEWGKADEQTAPIISFAILSFICIAIGFQLSFTLSSVSRLHSLVSSEVRSTSSSVNNLISRLMSGILLISLKFVLDYISMSEAFLVYLGIFMFSIIPLRALISLPPAQPLLSNQTKMPSESSDANQTVFSNQTSGSDQTAIA